MANYAYTNMGITTTTLTDAVDDSKFGQIQALLFTCLLYTSPSPRDTA